jgi:hypothetical protein
MGIEEGEEVQAKGMQNIFTTTKRENFPNLETSMPIQVQAERRFTKLMVPENRQE